MENLIGKTLKIVVRFLTKYENKALVQSREVIEAKTTAYIKKWN